MNVIKIQLFGCLIEAIGKAQIEITGINDLFSLRKKLISEFPQLRKYSFVTAVDQKIVKENMMLNSQQKIVLMPPFSGG